MTAITFTNPAVVRPRATRLRLTARGRRALAMLAALPAVIALAIAVIGGSSALASGEQGAPAGTFETVTVASGDTLWSIAQEVAPDADPRDVVAAIAGLNALGGSVLTAGQQLALPVEYSTGR
jgi:Tfp pilus assembly protein FimV